MQTVLYMVIVFLVFMMIRNFIVLGNRLYIINKISKYNLKQIECRKIDKTHIDYGCIEPYGKTLLRLWDFRCKNIVPKDVYKRIST